MLVQVQLRVFKKHMLYPQITLNVIDNSGVRKVRCIHIKNNNYFSSGTLGSLFVGVVFSLKSQKTKAHKFKRGQIVVGLFVSSTKEISINKYDTGFYIKYFNNNCMLLDSKSFKKNQTFLGSRSQGAISFFIKQRGFYKAYSLFDYYF
ncbi:MAG: hypothetical protein CMJ31_06970 [Phycisphaerae bacterium]|nr:hypothetical protein [Phycisphaerae bacterium]